MEFTNELLTILLSALGVIITGLATWLSAYLSKSINAKIKDRELAKWMSIISEVIVGAVQATFQSYVDALKKEGKFDKEAQKIALNKAVEIIEATLTFEAKKFIEENFGDIRAWIILQIESVIYSLKN